MQVYTYWGLAALSRKLRVACGLIWGRAYSPVPHKTDLIILLGEPISVTQVFCFSMMLKSFLVVLKHSTMANMKVCPYAHGAASNVLCSCVPFSKVNVLFCPVAASMQARLSNYFQSTSVLPVN